jgi:hypothetical protein
MIILLMLFRYWNTIWLNSELYHWFYSLTAATSFSHSLASTACVFLKWMRLLITLELKIEEACFIFSLYLSHSETHSTLLLLLCIFNLPLIVTAPAALVAASTPNVDMKYCATFFSHENSYRCLELLLLLVCSSNHSHYTHLIYSENYYVRCDKF